MLWRDIAGPDRRGSEPSVVVGGSGLHRGCGLWGHTSCVTLMLELAHAPAKMSRVMCPQSEV